MRSRLKRLEVRGYRCLGQIGWELHPDLTLVVGGNGSGKSSLLDAIQFLADLLLLGGGALRGEHRGCPGGEVMPLSDLVSVFAADRVLEYRLEFETPESGWVYTLTLQPVSASFTILQESLVVMAGDEPRLLLHRDGSGSRIRRGAGDGSEIVPIGPHDRQLALSFGADAVSHPEVHPAWRFIAGIRTLQLVPALMKQPGTPDGSLSLPDRYGRDLATRLHAMQTVQPGSLVDWLAAMSEFVGWSELRTPVFQGRVQPAFLEGASGAISLGQASDGSVVHAYLASLCAMPHPHLTLLLVDEPGLPIYPRDEHRLGELLRDLSVHIQTVVATHSTNLAEPLGNLQNTWSIERRPGDPAALGRLLQQGDADAIASDVASQGIGATAIDWTRTMSEHRR